jgi:hypothetical protein
VKPTMAFKNGAKNCEPFRSPLTGVDLCDCSHVKSRGIAPRSRGLAQPRSVAATIGAMRPTPAELEVARALIARVKATDTSIKRVDELLVCAAVACRVDELLAACRDRLRSGDGQEHIEAEAGDRLGRSA